MPRIEPLNPAVDLSSRRASVRFRSRLRGADRHVFAVDLYSHLRERHPETHLGYWVFALPEGEAETTIGIGKAGQSAPSRSSRPTKVEDQQRLRGVEHPAERIEDFSDFY